MFTQDQIDRMSPQQKALFALMTAAETFLTVSGDMLDAKIPGRGQANRALIDEGKAHLCISIQCGSGSIKADLALVKPEFGETLASPELTLHGSVASCFGDPYAVQVLDKGSMS